MAFDKPSPTQIAAQLNSGSIHLLRGLRRVDRMAGLTPARLSALSVLVFGGPSTLGHLAAAEDVAGPTMTRIVDGLVELGLAERSTHPLSGRAVLVSATASGVELMHEAARQRHQAIVTAMGRLTVRDRAALGRAAPALVRLAEAVRRSTPPGESGQLDTS